MIVQRQPLRARGLVAGVLVLGALGLGACGESRGGEVKGKTVRIPYLASAAGPAAGFKQDILVPPKLITAEVNGPKGPGNVPDLEFPRMEANLDPAQAVRNFRQVMKSDPVAVVGVESTTAAAIAPLANRAGVPFIATGASKINIATDNRPWVFSPWADQTKIQGTAVKNWIAQDPQVKRVVMIENNEEAASKTQGDAAGAAVEQTGAQLVGTVTFNTSTTDFAPVVARAASMHPDGIIIGSTPPEASSIDKEIKKQHLDVSGYQVQNTLAQGFFQTVGDAAKGFYGGTTFYVGASTPSVKRYVKSFEAQSGGVRPTYPQIYDGFQFLVAALKKANIEGRSTDAARKAIRDALDHACVNAVTGSRVCFSGHGYVDRPSILVRIGSGGSVSEVKTAQ